MGIGWDYCAKECLRETVIPHLTINRIDQADVDCLILFKALQ